MLIFVLKKFTIHQPQGYMIWKPKLASDEEIRNYSAPSLLRQYKENKWCTTNQTTYKNYYTRNEPSSNKPAVDTNNERSTSSQQGLQRDQLLSQNKNSRLNSRQGNLFISKSRRAALMLRWSVNSLSKSLIFNIPYIYHS